MTGVLLSRTIDAARRLDRRIGQRSGRRRILVDARTPVNFTMIAPVVQAMGSDSRVEFHFTASEEPARLRAIYHEAPSDVRLVDTQAARRMRFDAYVASDFMWQPLPRGTRRVQVFHGVGGKYGFDAPTTSMRVWDRIFFVNERRLRNFIKAGAIDADSPAIRLIGYPKADALANGRWSRDAELLALGLDPALPTVLYAPTWSPDSSLNALGVELIQRILAMDVNLIVKLHDRSRDPGVMYSGGVDWVARLTPVLAGRRGALATGHDISPYLAAADLMVTDHSSAGFEYLLLDRPLVRIDRPTLIRNANIHEDYVTLLASVSESVEDVEGAVRAIARGLAAPDTLSDTRRAVAADLFYRPGSATGRAVRALYEIIDLDPAPAVVTNEAPCQP
jgi:hypothetical protein